MRDKLEETRPALWLAWVGHWSGQEDGAMAAPSPQWVPSLPALACDGVRAICEILRWGVCHPPPAGRGLQGNPRPLCQEIHHPVFKPHETDPGEPMLKPHRDPCRELSSGPSQLRSLPSPKASAQSPLTRTLRGGIFPVDFRSPPQEGTAENWLVGGAWNRGFLPARLLPWLL